MDELLDIGVMADPGSRDYAAEHELRAAVVAGSCVPIPDLAAHVGPGDIWPSSRGRAQHRARGCVQSADGEMAFWGPRRQSDLELRFPEPYPCGAFSGPYRKLTE